MPHNIEGRVILICNVNALRDHTQIYQDVIGNPAALDALLANHDWESDGVWLPYQEPAAE